MGNHTEYILPKELQSLRQSRSETINEKAITVTWVAAPPAQPAYIQSKTRHERQIDVTCATIPQFSR